MTKDTKTTAIAAALVGVISLGFVVLVKNEYDKKGEQETKAAGFEAEIKKLETKVATKDTLEQELENLKTNFGQYVKILPSPEIATQERLMELVQDKSERADFDVKSFIQKDPKGVGGKKGAAKSAFREIEITLTAEGTFEQFLRFLNSLERHESFIRVNSFTCNALTTSTVDEEGKVVWPLNVQLNISTFRFDAGSGGK
jgi:Tfp pilus assembly protein PilO